MTKSGLQKAQGVLLGGGDSGHFNQKGQPWSEVKLCKTSGFVGH